MFPATVTPIQRFERNTDTLKSNSQMSVVGKFEGLAVEIYAKNNAFTTHLKSSKIGTSFCLVWNATRIYLY